MRNFGWDFARINVRLAESAQRAAQWNYGSSLNDFVERIGQDYWAVVGAEENLQVTESALKFNADLVRVNSISVKVGTLAPIDLQEAQSAAATAEANVYASEAALKSSRAQLRQDVMLNPAGTFLPENIEPAEGPNPACADQRYRGDRARTDGRIQSRAGRTARSRSAPPCSRCVFSRIR